MPYLNIVDFSTFLLLCNIASSCPQLSPVSFTNVPVAIKALRGLQVILFRVQCVSRSMWHAKHMSCQYGRHRDAPHPQPWPPLESASRIPRAPQEQQTSTTAPWFATATAGQTVWFPIRKRYSRSMQTRSCKGKFSGDRQSARGHFVSDRVRVLLPDITSHQSYDCGNALAYVTSSCRSTHCIAGSNLTLERKREQSRTSRIRIYVLFW